MRIPITALVILSALALGSRVLAQAPPPPPAPPAHHGILGHIFHRPGAAMPSQAPVKGGGIFRHGRPGVTTPSQAPIMGGIIGNKHSHVYHLPGDKGTLPAPQNRVYFRTVAQAIAAGYHQAGNHQAGSGGGTRHHGPAVSHRGSRLPTPGNR